MKDFFKDENITPEERERLEAEKAEKADVRLEENDNWEFEAEAHTLGSSVIENDEFEIVIPDAADERAAEPAPKPSAPKRKAAPSPKPYATKSIKGDKITFAITGVVVGIILAVCITLGVFYYAIPSKSIDENHLKPADIAMRVGDVDVSLGMYSYYYSVVAGNYISQSGYSNSIDVSVPFDQQTTTDSEGNTVTWQEVFEKETEDKIKYIMSFYQAGVENGVKLDSEQKETIKESIESLDQYASEAGLTIEGFISKNYGKHCNKEVLRVMLEQCYIAEGYYKQFRVESRPTVKDEQSYFDEISKDSFNNYLSVDAALLQVSYTMKDEASHKKALKKAEEYAKQIKSVDDMKKLIPTVYKDDIKQYVDMGYASSKDECAELIASSMQQNYCISQLSDGQRLPDEAERWLLSNKIKKSSVKYFDIEDDGVIYILFKASDATLDDSTLYSVRHILIKPQSDDDEEEIDFNNITKEQWKEAKTTADKILKEYNKGKKTEYAFAMLAEKYSDDTASVSEGGGFGGELSGIHKGEMVKEFEGWALEKGHKFGDVDIVKSKFGYHIMFFIKTDKAYLYSCESAVKDKKEENFLDSFRSRHYAGKVKKVIDSVDLSDMSTPEEDSSSYYDEEPVTEDDIQIEDDDEDNEPDYDTDDGD